MRPPKPAAIAEMPGTAGVTMKLSRHDRAWRDEGGRRLKRENSHAGDGFEGTKQVLHVKSGGNRSVTPAC